MKDMNALHRCEVMNVFYTDRMIRKYEFIKELYVRANHNWNQTFYYMLFRTMDIGPNRAAYEKLAERVEYNVILHECRRPKSVEALLLGASGLLTIYREDEYIVELKREAYYLLRKHEIEPLRFSDWTLRGVRPQNHPILRLSQLATFFSRHDFVMNDILDCRSAQDVERLFSVESMPYWDTHFIPADLSRNVPKRIGREKSHIFGINIVVPLQYAYGSYVHNDQLRACASSLLESLDAENNRYVREWANHGVKAANAFESQALLQISTEYCNNGRCEECFIGRRLAAIQERGRAMKP